jgi:endonuclease YncB( thermonuclease family)
MDMAPLGLLGLSLPLYLFSTRQIALFWRGLIWLLATGLLAAAAGLAFHRQDYAGLAILLQDAGDHWRHPSDSVLAQALMRNWPTVGAAIAPMFDLFFAAATVVALVCLFAFTPGEGVEKAVRPVNIALVGAIGGGLLALSVAAVGLGGETRPMIYAKVIQDKDVIDGDTVWMGDVSLRLWGIDAPEAHNAPQLCKDRSGLNFSCGEQARDMLGKMMDGKLVSCGPPPDGSRAGGTDIVKLKETFGRPIVACTIHDHGRLIGVQEQMARRGFADAYRDGDSVKSSDAILAAVETARQARAGIWAGWTVSPDEWRNDRQCRDLFAGATPQQLASLNSRVTCSNLRDIPPGGGTTAQNAPQAPSTLK